MCRRPRSRRSRRRSGPVSAKASSPRKSPRLPTSVYRREGFEPGYRTGRSIGVSYLEAPELKEGDKTVLKAGMTFAVDGGITVPGKSGGRIGDSIVVTKTGFEYLTEYPRDLLVV